MKRSHIPFLMDRDVRDQMPAYLYYQDIFSVVECNKIIEVGLERDLYASKIGKNDTDPRTRNSSNSWIEHSEDTNWIYTKIHNVLLDANCVFRYDLTDFGEQIQFTEYKVGQFYKWHTDQAAGLLSCRKLSVVVQLSDPRAYEGGELQIFSCRDEKIIKDRGSVIIFPSFKEHRVTPVTKGTRHSLVSWVLGSPFR